MAAVGGCDLCVALQNGCGWCLIQNYLLYTEEMDRGGLCLEQFIPEKALRTIGREIWLASVSGNWPNTPASPKTAAWISNSGREAAFIRAVSSRKSP